MRAVYQQDPDPTLHLVMNLHVDDEQLVIRINGLDADVHHGTTRHDALNATTNLETFLAIASGTLPVRRAINRGDLHIDTDPAPVERLFARFRLPTVETPNLPATADRP